MNVNDQDRYCHPERSEGSVSRWAERCFAELILRFAQDDNAVPSCCALARRERSPDCHPERSEGSVAMGREMLRCAQHDSTGFGR